MDKTIGLFVMDAGNHGERGHVYVSGAPFIPGDLDPLAHAEFCGGNAVADAALYCASPDLLAALERWARWYEQNSNPEVQGIACDTFAAIAKARGE